MNHLTAAVFPSPADAEHVLNWLRDTGVPDDAISVIARKDHVEQYVTPNDVGQRVAPAEADAMAASHEEGAEKAGSGALMGVGVGATVGVIFGLAAAAIPGVGPFITAGALASVLGTAGGAAAAGAIVGGVSGGIAGALGHWGMSEDQSHYYADAVERGGTFIGVDLSRTLLLPETLVEVFHRYHGTMAETPEFDPIP